MTHRKISDRQKLFVREYMVDLNATQAAIRAGYSRRSASQRGWALRRHPTVAARIEVAMADRDEAAKITPERVLCELARLSFANIQDYLQPGGAGGGGWTGMGAPRRRGGDPPRCPGRTRQPVQWA